MKLSAEASKRKKRLVALCRELPDAVAAVVGLKGEHLALKVRGKTFAYYAYDHHGDGRIALHCKGAPGEQGRLVQEDPKRFFVPPYLGKNGWVAVRLDLAKVDWSEIAYLLRTAYRLSAPKSLVAKLEESA
jgi:phosphoribosylglycinamide formyltransferase-1